MFNTQTICVVIHCNSISRRKRPLGHITVTPDIRSTLSSAPAAIDVVVKLDGRPDIITIVLLGATEKTPNAAAISVAPVRELLVADCVNGRLKGRCRVFYSVRRLLWAFSGLGGELFYCLSVIRILD